MKKFIKRIFIFFSPLLFFYALTILFYILTGELGHNYKFFQTSNEQSSKTLGLLYSENDRFYKSWGTKIKQPDILALGSSRALQIRQEFFTKASFFNAGRIIYMPQDLTVFFEENKTELNNKLIILCIDHWWFNRKYFAKTAIARKEEFSKSKITPDYVLNMAKPLLESIRDKEVNITRVMRLRQENRIGVTAILHKKGYRVDGSYHYGDEKRIIDSYPNFEGMYKRIKNGINRLDYGEELEFLAINELDKFLKLCQINNTEVVGFLTPFPKTVWEKIITNGKHSYMKKIAPALVPLFDKYNFVFTDYSDASLAKIIDEESIDGLHCSEKAYLKIILELCELSPALNELTDTVFLEQKLAETKSHYEVF